MSGYLAFFPILAHLALVSSLLLSAGTVAVLCIRQPARRIRIIELTLAGLLLAPALAVLPGYPRWVVQWSGLTPAAEPVLESEGSWPALPASDGSEFSGTLLTVDEAQAEESVTPPADAESIQQPAQLTENEPAGWSEFLMDESASPPLEPALAELVATMSGQDASETSGVSSAVSSANEALLATESGEAAESVAEPVGWISEHSVESFPGPLDLRFVIVTAYGIGLALSLGWSLMGGAVLWRLLRSARPADERCRDLLRAVAGPESDRVNLLVSPLVRQPCAIAWRGRPIVLPESLYATASPQELRWAIAHEWSHVARRDVWSWVACGLARALYFYQPLAWWLRGQLQLCQDFVADAEAARSGGADSCDAAVDYAEFLAIYASRLSRPILPAGLGIGGRSTDLQRRVIMLVQSQRPLERTSPRKWNLVALPAALVIVLGVGSLGVPTSGAADEASGPAQAAGETKETVPTNTAAPAATAPAATPNPGVASTPAAPFTAAAVPATTPAPPTPAQPTAPAKAATTPAQPTAPSVRGNSGAGVILWNSQPAAAAKPPASGATQITYEATVKEAPAEPPVVSGELTSRNRYGKPGGAGAAGFSPRAPRTIAVGDQLRLDVMASSGMSERETVHILLRPDIPAEVEADGSISLGSHYGHAQVAGKGLGEAEELIGATITARLEEDMLTRRRTNAEPEAAKRVIVNARVVFASTRPVALSGTYSPAAIVAPATGAVPGISVVGPATLAPPAATPALPARTALGGSPSASRQYSQVQGALPGQLTGQIAWHEQAKATAEKRKHAIQPGDALVVEVEGYSTKEGGPRSSVIVEPEGTIALGASYGRVKVEGKTLLEAEEAITSALREKIDGPQVQVTYLNYLSTPVAEKHDGHSPAAELVQPRPGKDQQLTIEHLEQTLRKVREERDEIQRMYQKAKQAR